MIEQLIQMSISYGFFAVLFVWLLYTTNKRNERREIMYQKAIKKNQEIIFEQAQSFSHLSDHISEMRGMLSRGRAS